MIENKPCPFCGSNELSYQVSTEDREGIPTNIFCQDCGCSGPWIYLKRCEVEGIHTPSQGNDDGSTFDPLPKRALELWNKRK